MTGGAELAARLSAAADDGALAALGFRNDDRDDVKLALAAALADRERMAEIQLLADRLRVAIGRIDRETDAFDVPAAASDWRGVGVTPMLALLAVADDVRAFHRSRGVPPEISNRSLSDLGQQAWVHRRTYGTFGVHTYAWLVTAFSGNLYWLGRLQFNLVHRSDGWVLSTHIPESGPLTPEAVDDSFREASAFFAAHFPDYPTELFHCGSWLLDPQLAQVLKPDSNMVRFQQRWNLEEEVGPGDADAIFFVFRRRGDVDRSTLPRDTTLQRAILDKIDAGGHWALWSGTTPQAPFRAVHA
ncbi:acyltransferase domain-containing protein [Gryllotalpicola protaetiae]|uniref:acyltransferase domain-containing protein n=1 Tax=Gryllotalpicola protaetiae TaxID=2419771 RepID=UPI0013C43983|nr:acyltransferase domain-containing protein [Gryllotalpicola protaetiae]